MAHDFRHGIRGVPLFVGCTVAAACSTQITVVQVGDGGADASRPTDGAAPGDVSRTDRSSRDVVQPPDRTTDVGGADVAPCGAGEHRCGSTCLLNDINSCGPACVSCAAPMYGTATCDGTKCGFTCDVVKCGSSCADPMIDPKNCGSCGHVCSVGSCISGSCTPVLLASGGAVATSVAVDAKNAYWAGAGSGVVAQVPLAGGPVVTLASGGGTAQGILVTSGTVFWTSNAGYYTSGGLDSVPIGGGPMQTLYSSASCYDVVANSTTVFSNTSANAVISLPLGGTTTSTLVTSAAAISDVLADDTYVYWTTGTGDCLCNELLRMPLAGGTTKTLVSGLYPLDRPVLDATSVYYENYDMGELESVPIGGGSPTTLTSIASAGGLAMDSTNLYWTTVTKPGYISSMPKGGGPVTTVIAGLNVPNALAVGTNVIVWGDNDGLHAVSK